MVMLRYQSRCLHLGVVPQKYQFPTLYLRGLAGIGVFGFIAAGWVGQRVRWVEVTAQSVALMILALSCSNGQWNGTVQLALAHQRTAPNAGLHHPTT